MPLPKMRSIQQIIQLIKQEDPDSQINYNMIRRLCLDNRVKHFRSGRKFIVNYEDLVNVLSQCGDEIYEMDYYTEDI